MSDPCAGARLPAPRSRRHRLPRHEPTPGAVETLATVARPHPVRHQQRLPRTGRGRRSTCARWASPPNPTTSSPAPKAPRACWRTSCPPAQRFSSSAPTRWPPRSDESDSSPVRQWSDGPVAVVQGHSPQTGWPDLAEAALAIRGGALWVAANVDKTLPSERGLLPGNGSMVAALRAATDQRTAGGRQARADPADDALARGNFRTPLVVGDRLDTDIAGANAAGLPSLLVLTGVSTAADMVHAAVRRAAQLHRRRSALAATPAPTSFASGRTRLAHRHRPVRGDRAVDRPRPGRPAVGGACHRQRGLGRAARRPPVHDGRRRRHGATGPGAVVPAQLRRIG